MTEEDKNQNNTPLPSSNENPVNRCANQCVVQIRNSFKRYYTFWKPWMAPPQLTSNWLTFHSIMSILLFVPGILAYWAGWYVLPQTPYFINLTLLYIVVCGQPLLFYACMKPHTRFFISQPLRLYGLPVWIYSLVCALEYRGRNIHESGFDVNTWTRTRTLVLFGSILCLLSVYEALLLPFIFWTTARARFMWVLASTMASASPSSKENWTESMDLHEERVMFSITHEEMEQEIQTVFDVRYPEENARALERLQTLSFDYDKHD